MLETNRALESDIDIVMLVANDTQLEIEQLLVPVSIINFNLHGFVSMHLILLK